MKNNVRILLVDDHYVVRMGLAAILQMEEGIEVAAHADDMEQAISAYRVHRPDVTLMDLRMPGGTGVDATQAIRAEFPDARILMLTTYDGDEDVYRALKAGARGYLLKSATGDELLNAIRCLHEGGSYVPAQIVSRLAERESSASLTPREMEVLQLMSKGLSNREIGDVLGFSENTAKAHVKHIFVKVDACDRTEAIRIAVQRGILHLD